MTDPAIDTNGNRFPAGAFTADPAPRTRLADGRARPPVSS